MIEEELKYIKDNEIKYIKDNEIKYIIILYGVKNDYMVWMGFFGCNNFIY
ncbi:MAG: hypothetical protein K0R06_3131 [Clostridium sp.]|jgi:predicted nucleic acid-binding Zn finger protein|nr:hypothetical protein [Clostridium sp.]